MSPQWDDPGFGPMTTEEAYSRLGLIPLDQFLGRTIGTRQIGATTWMCVEAALQMKGGKKVYLVAPTRRQIEQIHHTVRVFAENLDIPTQGLVPGYNRTILSLRTFCRRSTRPSVVNKLTHRGCSSNPIRFLDGVVLDDTEWSLLAQRRRQGVFARITEVRQVSKRFFAFEVIRPIGRRTFLMELTADGASELGVPVISVALPTRYQLSCYHIEKDFLTILKSVYAKLGIPPGLARDDDASFPKPT